MTDYKVRLSDMRTRITFQQPTLVEDAGGAQVPGWSNVATNPTVWARWINAHGQEVIQSDSKQATQRATVTIRYRDDVSATWRILKDGDAWEIISPDPVQDRNRWIELIVERTKGTV